MSRRGVNRFRPALEAFEDRTVPTAVVGVTASDTFEGSATGGLSFVRSNDDLSGSLTVTYSVGGTAVPGSDYTPLTGSVTFAVGQNWVDVPVTALTPDGGKTVTGTLTGGGSTYTIDPTEPSATANIDAQPVVVDVFQQTDGAEGIGGGTPTPGAFQFVRSGDLSAPLTATYAVSGSAVAGTNYTALPGSVTFPAGQSAVSVPVPVLNDHTPDPTMTVTATVTAGTGYAVGNATDTVLIRDADTRQVVWVGGDPASPTEWNDARNWSVVGTGAAVVPQATDDVYFTAGSYNCADAGYGLSSLYGLHLVGGYQGTVTLAGGLSVGTYEQTAGTLDQPTGDLTVATALVWGGGTVNALAGGNNLNVAGFGRIGPDTWLTPVATTGDVARRSAPAVAPGGGAIAVATADTIKVLGVLQVRPGTLDFTGNSGGMLINAEVDLITSQNVASNWGNPTVTSAKIAVAAGARFKLTNDDPRDNGRLTTALAIQNQGAVSLSNMHLVVNGSLAGGPSISQTGAGSSWTWQSGSNIQVASGMALTNGALTFVGVAQNTKAQLLGSLTVGDGTTNPTISFQNLPLALTSQYVLFSVTGDVTWNSGTYTPRVNGAVLGQSDSWRALDVFTVGAAAAWAPTVDDPAAVVKNEWWTLLTGLKGIVGAPPALPAGLAGYGIQAPKLVALKAARWDLYKK